MLTVVTIWKITKKLSAQRFACITVAKIMMKINNAGKKILTFELMLVYSRFVCCEKNHALCANLVIKKEKR
jgi:hypothetical protein